MRQQLPFSALWPAFGITADIREKLLQISPTATLESKIETGCQALKKYNAPCSLYQRLMESDALSCGVKAERSRLYNPVRLQYHVNKAVLALREAVAARLSSDSEPAA
ncbi:MAG: hypothetical protein LBD93_04385 [Treponema sp.]|jgi:hypothetical protein|nr:hypothetical protein [Treponema sp.]